MLVRVLVRVCMRMACESACACACSPSHPRGPHPAPCTPFFKKNTLQAARCLNVALCGSKISLPGRPFRIEQVLADLETAHRHRRWPFVFPTRWGTRRVDTKHSAGWPSAGPSNPNSPLCVPACDCARLLMRYMLVRAIYACACACDVFPYVRMPWPVYRGVRGDSDS